MKKSKPVTRKKMIALPAAQEAIVATPEVQPPTSSPDSLIATAIQKGLDIGTIERLMEMRDKEIARLAKMEYLQAMSRFQEMIPDMMKNRKVDYTSKKEGATNVKYNYQDLGSIIQQIKPAMAQCGLTHSWEQTEKDGQITVVCIISHVGGHIQRGEPLSGVADTSGNKVGLHAKASTITYLQRYTLKGILGLTSTETDDDGQLGNKAKVEEGGLPFLNPNQEVGTAKKIASGEWTVAYLKTRLNLTQSQESRFQEIEDSRLESAKAK